MKDDKIAIQLYTLRELAAQDMLGTLRTVARLGYRAVEFAGFGNSSAEEIRPLMQELGLRTAAAHVGFDKFVSEPESLLGDLQTVGCGYAIVPSIPEDRRRTAAQARAVATSFNRFGELSREKGMRFAFHNHAFDFAVLDGASGTTLFDILMTETDPSLVDFELDIFWALYAGVDPIPLLKKLSGRVPLVHVKDMAGDESRADRPVGEGVLPWGDILKACADAGTQWYVVEQDHPSDPVPNVETSLLNLRKLI